MIASAALLMTVGAGCAATPSPSQQATTPANPSSVAAYEPFTLSKYQAALAAHEPIFLYFYANWCPFCREQDPRNVEVLKDFSGRVHGFRVNYNDSDTDADEKALANTFRVTYQHTGVFFDQNGQEIKRTIGTQSNEQLQADLKLIAL